MIWFIIAAVIVGLDQFFKYMVISNISLTDTVEFIKGIINFVYVKNTGAAFGIFAGKTYILSIVSVLVCAALILFMIKNKNKSTMLSLSLSMVLGGAIGNLIDRIVRGYVIDYIEPMFIDFPVINFADVAITVGAFLLVIYVIFFDGKKE